MKKILFLFIITFFVSTKINAQWQSLFNAKNLKGWDTYLGPQFPTEGVDRTGVLPIGLNVDPKKVFTVVELDGKKVMRISGENFGGVSTKKEFENYHLTLQFKWGKNKFHPKENSKFDSGVLYHANGKHGADWGFWMQSQEFQLQEGDCGDYWGCAGAIFDIPAVKEGEKKFRYSKTGEMYTFEDKTNNGRHCIKNPDSEKPTGEWNTLDLYCFGDTSVHVINGKVNMVLFHSKHKVNGQYEPLTKGKIQLQSEGAEVYYKNIKIQRIKELPENIL